MKLLILDNFKLKHSSFVCSGLTHGVHRSAGPF